HTPISFAGDLSLATEWERLLRLVSTVKALDNAPQGQIYYGLVATQNGGDTWVGNSSFIAGIGWIGDRAAVSLDLGSTRQETTGRIAAHEIGHNHGRFHAPCGALGSTSQPYPYSGALIGPDNVGYDYASNRVWVPGTPDQARDIMSYCTPQWMSDFTYRGIYDNARTANTLVADPGINGVLVRVQFDGYGIPSLAPVYEVEQVAMQGIGQSAYTAELLDTRGAVIASYPLEVTLAQNEPPISVDAQGGMRSAGEEARPTASIIAVLPMPSQPVARIRITRQGASIAEQAIMSRTTHSSPLATLERGASGAVLRWTPADRPALVRYSADGQRWITLGVDVLGGMLPIDARLDLNGTFKVIPAGGQAMTASGV
ncbi:MAG TPA: hypothetical protein VFT99_11660, partial [Roseiflexaceae bacterium]|nr:hypothetical protein [Roseiflexaceae bacterium]